MKLINTYTLEIKKSKFIAYYYEVNSKEEIDTILDNLNKEHKKARHIPYAYKIGNLIRKSDDKEPSNTAGTPIYNIIMKNKRFIFDKSSLSHTQDISWQNIIIF